MKKVKMHVRAASDGSFTYVVESKSLTRALERAMLVTGALEDRVPHLRYQCLPNKKGKDVHFFTIKS